MTDMRHKHDWWQRGRAVDLWSIPHFLFGVLMAFLPPLTGLSLPTTLALTVILAITWEMYEGFIKIRETNLNSIIDILLPILAFIITSYLLRSYPYRSDDLSVIAGAVFIVYAFTNISGWLAYRRRNRDFTH